MSDVIVIQHGGSDNHGCEALARSFYDYIEEYNPTLYSGKVSQDKAVKLPYKKIKNGFISKRFSLQWFLLKICRLCPCILKTERIAYHREIKIINRSRLIISIGGDNYCYDKGRNFYFIDKSIGKSSAKYLLAGCSIEPEDIPGELKDNLLNYDLIIARESLTYNALRSNSINNVKLIPDSAFSLKTIMLPLPDKFIKNNTIGINISPLIFGSEKIKGITLANYVALIQYIIDHTDMQIALIPHVVLKNNDDRKPIFDLMRLFKESGRVFEIKDCNAMQLKGYIARCRMFIGARTHATIAAYSSCVPTIVIGYSVKSKGIAQDIFGTYENYVIPVQSLQQNKDLINAFIWLCEHENEIRSHLKKFMVGYINQTQKIGVEVRKLLSV